MVWDDVKICHSIDKNLAQKRFELYKIHETEYRSFLHMDWLGQVYDVDESIRKLNRRYEVKLEQLENRFKPRRRKRVVC